MSGAGRSPRSTRAPILAASPTLAGGYTPRRVTSTGPSESTGVAAAPPLVPRQPMSSRPISTSCRQRTVSERRPASARAAAEGELGRVESATYAKYASYNMRRSLAQEGQHRLKQATTLEHMLRRVPPQSADVLGDSATAAALLGPSHAVVGLVQRCESLAARVEHVEAATEELLASNETLEHMLGRGKEQHAQTHARLSSARAERDERNEELAALRLTLAEAQRVVGTAQAAARSGCARRRQNAALYTSELRRRRQQVRQRLAAESNSDSSGSRGGGGARRREDERSTRESQLQRILVVDRMKSLVLTRDRESNVEQVSRYESAFLKMARVAGFSDPHAVIQRFLSRHENRAALLKRRNTEHERLGALEQDHKRTLSRMAELQNLMVHPAQTDTDIKAIEPRVASATARVTRLRNAAEARHNLRLRVMMGLEHLLHLAEGVMLPGEESAAAPKGRRASITEQGASAAIAAAAGSVGSSRALQRGAEACGASAGSAGGGGMAAAAEGVVAACEARLLAMLAALKECDGAADTRVDPIGRDAADTSPPRAQNQNNVRVEPETDDSECDGATSCSSSRAAADDGMGQESVLTRSELKLEAETRARSGKSGLPARERLVAAAGR